jgi:HEPN domain-containing protein
LDKIEGQNILFVRRKKFSPRSKIPAKSHDLTALAAPLVPAIQIPEAELDFLTQQRIPAFYGADDFIPDQEYTESDGLRCLTILQKLFPAL